MPKQKLKVNLWDKVQSIILICSASKPAVIELSGSSTVIVWGGPSFILAPILTLHLKVEINSLMSSRTKFIIVSISKFCRTSFNIRVYSRCCRVELDDPMTFSHIVYRFMYSVRIKGSCNCVKISIILGL